LNLRDRWVLVTGAAKRVGRSIALELGARGANVVVHYNRSQHEAEATAEDLRRSGVQAVTQQADLADAVAVRSLAAAAEAAGGREGVAALVNSASNYLRRPWEELDEAVWDASLDVNLKAPYLLSWSLGRAMWGRGEGTIVNVVDWAAARPYRHYLPYCVSKAGLVCLTKALAKELAPHVRVNAVAPGPVLLPDDVGEQEAEAIRRATVLRRIGEPDDVARAVRFLIEEATFSTGALLHVDGGRAVA
jgi:NAD(P)-dependent dehydrogenase (short-subunit alcohol dehydrogenase family)